MLGDIMKKSILYVLSLILILASNSQLVIAKASALTENEKIFQVLNRLTYGPKPGDLEYIKKNWLKQVY